MDDTDFLTRVQRTLAAGACAAADLKQAIQATQTLGASLRTIAAEVGVSGEGVRKVVRATRDAVGSAVGAHVRARGVGAAALGVILGLATLAAWRGQHPR